MRRYKYGAVLTALLALLLLSGSGVMAAEALTINHEPVVEAPANSPLTITAEVRSENRIQRVILFMRTAGTNQYYKIAARAKADNTYEAVIPADFLPEGTLEYYLQAEDVEGNRVTFPGVNAAGDPLRAEVVPDTTVPTASMVAPKGMIGEDPFAVMITLADDAANINPDTVQVFLNGEEITGRAHASARSIRFQVRAGEILTSNTIMIRVMDRAGNMLERSFRLTQHPIITGSYQIAFKADGEGSEISNLLSLEGSWDKFTASVELESEDLGSSPITGTYNVSYHGDHLEVGLIDTTTSLSDLTASDYGHRGIDIDLKYGPGRTTVGYGYAAHYVAGEQYGRRFLGLRQGLDFGPVNFGINFNEIIDEAATVDLEVNPEQNYVFSLDGGLNIKGFTFNTEVATSVYFSNARGNLWENIDELPDDFGDFDLSSAKDTLGDAPDLLKRLLPLPLDPDNTLTSLEQYFKSFDLGAKVEVEAPLPGAEVSASYYLYGPNFVTLAGSGEKDAQGYSLSLKTDRFEDRFDLQLDYGQYRDNLPTVLNRALGTEPEGETTNYLDYEAEVGIYADKFDTAVGYAHEDEKDYETAVLKSDQNTFSVKVKNIAFKYGDWNSKLSTAYSTSKYNEYDAAGTTVVGGKQTNKGRVKVNFSKAPWRYDLGYSFKTESDFGGSEVNSPTITFGPSWSKKDVQFGEQSLYRLKVASDLSYTQSRGDSVKEDKLSLGLKVGAGINSDSAVTLRYDHSTTTDHLDSSNNSTDNTVELEYSIDF